MRRTLVLLVLLVVLAVPAAAHTNHVSADTQVSTDGEFVVEAIFPAGDVWVAAHLDDDGDPGEVVGSRRLAGGSFHTDVPVNVENETWDDWSGSRRIHVVLHRPNGDGEFDAEEDETLTRFTGDIVSDQLTLQKGPTARVTAESFGPETANESAVTLRSVVLPEEGYVVVHNTSADGDVVGHAALEAGTHDAVRVDLDDSFYRNQGEQFKLFASIVIDDGDGEFDAEDSHLVAETEPVGTLFGVENPGADGGDLEQNTDADEPTLEPETATPSTETATSSGTETATSTRTETATPSATETVATSTDGSQTTTESAPTSGDGDLGVAAGIAVLLSLIVWRRYR